MEILHKRSGHTHQRICQTRQAKGLRMRVDKDDAGNLKDFIRNDQGAAVEVEYFVPNYSQGLTQTALARRSRLLFTVS